MKERASSRLPLLAYVGYISCIDVFFSTPLHFDGRFQSIDFCRLVLILTFGDVSLQEGRVPRGEFTATECLFQEIVFLPLEIFEHSLPCVHCLLI